MRCGVARLREVSAFSCTRRGRCRMAAIQIALHSGADVIVRGARAKRALLKGSK
jgi:hypothetical protein